MNIFLTKKNYTLLAINYLSKGSNDAKIIENCESKSEPSSSTNNTNSLSSSSGGRFLAIRNWIKQNRWRKKDKTVSQSTSPLVIQEVQTSNPDKDSPQTSSLDKKAMKKNAKNGKNTKFKKLNSDYSLNNNLNKADNTATLTGVNTNLLTNCGTVCSKPLVTNFADNTPLKNLTNNNKILTSSPNQANDSLNNTSPESRSKIFTPLTNGSFNQLAKNSQLDKKDYKNNINSNDKNTSLIYVTSNITQLSNNASPLSTNPNYRSKRLLIIKFLNYLYYLINIKFNWILKFLIGKNMHNRI